MADVVSKYMYPVPILSSFNLCRWHGQETLPQALEPFDVLLGLLFPCFELLRVSMTPYFNTVEQRHVVGKMMLFVLRSLDRKTLVF